MSVLVKMNADGGLTVLDGLSGYTFNRRGECSDTLEKFTISRMRGFLALPVISILQCGNNVDVASFRNQEFKRYRCTGVPSECLVKLQQLGGFIRMVYRRGIQPTDEGDVKFIQTLFIYSADVDITPHLVSVGCVEVG